MYRRREKEMSEEMSFFDEVILQGPLLIILVPLILGVILLIFRNILGIVLIPVAAIFLVICLKKIPADPPHFAIVMIWGERKDRTKKEGWRLKANFPPLMLDLLPINAEKKNKDFIPKDVRSEDKAEIHMEISLTYKPDPDNANEYINTGKEEGVNNILDDKIEEITRQWAIDQKTWFDCMKAKADVNEKLIKEITGITDEKGKDAKQIEAIRRANGSTKVRYLGIILTRLNVGTMKPKGKLAEIADRVAIEQLERDAEKVELEHVQQRIADLMKLKGMSIEDAAEIVMAERGKISKHVSRIRGLENGGALPLVQIGGGAERSAKRDRGDRKDDEKESGKPWF